MIGCASSVKITTIPSDKYVTLSSSRQPLPHTNQIAERIHDHTLPSTTRVRTGTNTDKHQRLDPASLVSVAVSKCGAPDDKRRSVVGVPPNLVSQ